MAERKRAPRRTHEVADVDWRPVWRVAAALVAVLLLVAIAAAISRSLLSPASTNVPALRPPEIFGPELQSTPSLDLNALRNEKAALLGEYRWIDRDKGVVRIPIERAMQLLAERSASASGAVNKPAGTTP